MLQISEIVKKNEEMFDLFNQHFYNGELIRPAITVSPDGGHGGPLAGNHSTLRSGLPILAVVHLALRSNGRFLSGFSGCLYLLQKQL